MANLESYGLNSWRCIKEDGTIVNMADIQGATIRSGSLIGRATLTATATALRVGTADLTSRYMLQVINDSSDIIFVDFNSAVNTTTSFLINSGTGYAFKFDPNDPVTMWGLTTENETDIGIWELK